MVTDILCLLCKHIETGRGCKVLKPVGKLFY